MTNPTVDSDLVRTLADLLNETNLTEIEYEKGDLRLRVARGGAPMAQFAAPAPAVATPAVEADVPDDFASHPGAVNAPMVGVIYTSPEPGAPAFVKEGDAVTKGDTMFLIEAMKTFNPVHAHKGGKIARILVNDGTPVEFGEPLLIIE